jgi:hypothetical protein
MEASWSLYTHLYCSYKVERPINWYYFEILKPIDLVLETQNTTCEDVVFCVQYVAELNNSLQVWFWEDKLKFNFFVKLVNNRRIAMFPIHINNNN